MHHSLQLTSSVAAMAVVGAVGMGWGGLATISWMNPANTDDKANPGHAAKVAASTEPVTPVSPMPPRTSITLTSAKNTADGSTLIAPMALPAPLPADALVDPIVPAEMAADMSAANLVGRPDSPSIERKTRLDSN